MTRVHSLPTKKIYYYRGSFVQSSIDKRCENASQSGQVDSSKTPQIEAQRLLSRALESLDQGRPDLAEATVRELLSQQPRNAQAYFALGMVAEARGKPFSAIERMRDALRCDSKFVHASERLAILYLQMGDLLQAQKFADLTLELERTNVNVLVVLAQLHVQRNESTDALAILDRAIAYHPHDVWPRILKARLLCNHFRLAEALAVYQDAARLTQDPQIQIEMGELQSQMGMFADALISFKVALEADPNSLTAQLMVARALTNLHRPDEAALYWEQAEAHETTLGQTRYAKSLSLALSGDFAASTKEALKALQLNSTWGKPHHTYFASRKTTEVDRQLIDHMEFCADSVETHDGDRVDFLYALGKAYDDLGEYEIALKRFDAANALARKLKFGDMPFDREAFKASIDQTIDAFSKTWFASPTESQSDLPLFVLGMIRSGTTLVDQILSSHTQVGGAGEQGFWLQNESAIINYSEASIDFQEAKRLAQLYSQLLTSLSPGSKLVIDKNPANVLVAGLLHTLFPNSRIICTRRNAVDTALSIWMTQMQTNAPFVCDRSDIVFAYKEFLRLTNHWKSVLPADRYLEVEYESLIGDPEIHTRNLVAFCGLDWQEACLRPELNSRLIRTPSFWQARQPIYSTSIDRWKRYEQWLGPFEELIGL